MKDQARWDDKTGNARQTLQAFVFIDPISQRVVLVAKQQMDYGKWLELSNGGKYAIVMRALRANQAVVWQSVKEAVR